MKFIFLRSCPVVPFFGNLGMGEWGVGEWETMSHGCSPFPLGCPTLALSRELSRLGTGEHSLVHTYKSIWSYGEG